MLATRNTFFSTLRICAAIASSPTVTPTRASSINSTTSASSIAFNDCSAISTSMPCSLPSIPPVSTTINSRPSYFTVPYLRSRVRPGKSATRASRLRVKRLNSVDLPTFARPTRATTGNIRCTSKITKQAKSWPVQQHIHPTCWFKVFVIRLAHHHGFARADSRRR